MVSPKNIVHVSQDDITNNRIKHVTQAEITALAILSDKIDVISFKDSAIVSSATDAGTYLTFKINDVVYAIKLYIP